MKAHPLISQLLGKLYENNDKRVNQSLLHIEVK